MIASIKAEWRKNRFRPAFLVSTGLIAGDCGALLLGRVVSGSPSGRSREAVSILTLFPDQFVNNVMGRRLSAGSRHGSCAGRSHRRLRILVRER